MSDLKNPSASHAPLVALVKVSPSDMSDSELSETIAKLRALRTTSTTKKAAMTTKRKTAQLPFNIDELLV